MPDAVRAYITPIQRAVSCLAGVAKIVNTSGLKKVGDHGSWILNGPEGMALRGFGTFYAQQHYEVVETSDEHFAETHERFRVSTRDYNYRLVLNSGPEIRWHWHPKGTSPERRPHIHPSFNLDAHMPSGRAVLEEVVGCVHEDGVRTGPERTGRRVVAARKTVTA